MMLSLRSLAIWSCSLPCAGTGAYLILQWASSLAANSPSKRKVNTFPQVCGCWGFFPALDYFTFQAVSQAFIKLSITPVSAHPWTVQHWSCGVCYAGNSSQRISPRCETPLLQLKSFNLLATQATSAWVPASYRVVFALEKQIFQRSGSGNLTVKLRLYGPIHKDCQWKLWVFLLKSKHLP